MIPISNSDTIQNCTNYTNFKWLPLPTIKFVTVKLLISFQTTFWVVPFPISFTSYVLVRMESLLILIISFPVGKSKTLGIKKKMHFCTVYLILFVINTLYSNKIYILQYKSEGHKYSTYLITFSTVIPSFNYLQWEL